MVRWSWYEFNGFSPQELYSVLRARQEVFVVEQTCAYLDLDDLDQGAMHLCAWAPQAQYQLLAYLRVVFPGDKFDEISIGRVLTSSTGRNRGLGKLMMVRALEWINDNSPGDVRLSAQSYLKRFYGGFGFDVVSEEYLEDGIPHVEMLKKANGR